MVARQGIRGADFAMKATVAKFNRYLPMAQAVTKNSIAVAFKPPLDGSIALSHELDLDLEKLDVEQAVTNLTTGQTLHLRIASHDVHDLRLPLAHGTSRFPSVDRRRGA
jgi:hypothetical protein